MKKQTIIHNLKQGTNIPFKHETLTAVINYMNNSISLDQLDMMEKEIKAKIFYNKEYFNEDLLAKDIIPIIDKYFSNHDNDEI